MGKKLLCSLLFLFALLSANGQASWEKFGQNRMQYRVFPWKYYDSTHFRAFYYEYGKGNAMFAVTLAEQELAHIVYMMGGRLNKKLNLVLYNSFGDYRQTNIGRKNDDINQANGGKVDVVGDQVPLYFNGDHAHLKRQIRRGIAKVIKDNMLFGDNLKDVVKNAVQMNLPEWYTLGYVSFIADEWTGEKDAELKNILSRELPKRRINDLALQHGNLFGHSFWQFVSQRYGENYISNLLYLTRYRKSVSNAIEIIFRKSAAEVYQEWEAFYFNLSLQAVNQTDSLAGRALYSAISIKQGAQISQVHASPSGREVAYVEKLDGQFTVYIKDVFYNKTYPIIEGGSRSLGEMADPDYPVLCWSPSGKKLAALYQQKNILYLRIFTTGKRIMEKRAIPSRKIERITGMCFMGDEHSMAITGIKKGQSDLYILAIKNNRLDPITNDIFDEKDPSFVQNGVSNGILFLSNRTTRFTNELTKSTSFSPNFNMFLWQPENGTNLTRLSQTNGTIHHPIQWGTEQFAYLEDKDGKVHRQIVSIVKSGVGPDTISVMPASPTPFSVLTQAFLTANSNVVEVNKSNNEIRVYRTHFDTLKKRDTAYHALLKRQQDSSVLEKPLEVKPEISEYLTPFDRDTTQSIVLDQIFANTQKSASRYQLFDSTTAILKPKPYQTTFYPDFIQTTLDNTLLFTRYQPISTQFNNIGLAGFLTSTLTDIMEDYKLTGGARLGIDLRSLDYFLQFANYRRRVDWGLLYYHSNTTEESLPPLPYYSPFLVLGKRGMDYFQANITYPFSMQKSLHLQTGVRYDRTRYLAQDQYSIEIPSSRQFWTVNRAEFIYDNTVNPMINIWKGSRVKFFGEYQYQLTSPNNGFTVIGYDARHYKTLYKNVILASRFAGSHSLSKTKVLYFLGGVDNPLISQFDQNTMRSPNEDYAFQTLATNLRGYKQGARNGSSYIVINEEVRLPVYNTFFKRPVKSGFVRNMQVVAFVDAGMGIRGIFPNGDNIVHDIRIQDPQSNVAVLINREAALGYGLGLRSRFLGYFIRADFAWNIEGSYRPVLHLSMATDF
jgi:hypothetical protein